MIEIFIIGLIFGAFIVGIPLFIDVMSDRQIKENIDEISVKIDSVVEDDVLDSNEYKFSSTPSNELENPLVKYAQKQIRDQHIITPQKEVMIKNIDVYPNEWIITFEVSGEE